MTRPSTFEEAVDRVLAEMRFVMIERQKKYGPENIRNLGVIGVIQRAMHDKGQRLLRFYDREDLRAKCLAAGMPVDVLDKHLPSHSGDFPDDSVEDAHLDMANYSGVISIMLRRGWWGIPLEQDVKNPEV